jgi:hypothetical protein
MSQRLSITFDDVGTGALMQIKKMTSIVAVADVVRLALTVLKALLNAEKRGCQIIMRSHDGQQFLYSLSRPTEMVEIKGTPQAAPTTISLDDLIVQRARASGSKLASRAQAQTGSAMIKKEVKNARKKELETAGGRQ